MTHSDRPPERRRADGRSTRLAASALRLLLDHPLLDLDELDWADMTRLAERGGVVVRLADAVRRRSEDLPAGLAESAARGCARTQQAVALIDQLSNACKRLGLAHAFLKTVERYPDSGPDIDLLIAAASPALDAAILEHLPAIPCRRPLRHRLTGSRTYRAAFGLVIDVHHGRLGVFGEQARYARIVLSRARPAALGATMCLAPSPEDNLLLIATQQAYTRPALRIANVYAAITALQRPERGHHHPTHHQVEKNRRHAIAPVEEDILHHSEHRETPDDPEEPPSPRSAQHGEREWRVRAGDQQVDRAVIENMEELLGLAPQ